MMFLWFLIIGGLVFFLIRGDLNYSAYKRRSADNYLDERLAKGEISIEQYQELKTTLKEKK